MYSSYSDVSSMIGVGQLIFWGIVIYFFVVGIYMAKKFAEAAEAKGYNGGYFWIVFFCGIFGMLYIIALPDRNNKNIIIKENNQDTKKESTVDDDRLPEL